MRILAEARVGLTRERKRGSKGRSKGRTKEGSEGEDEGEEEGERREPSVELSSSAWGARRRRDIRTLNVDWLL